MDLLADEDIDSPIVEILRKEDFNILYVNEEMKGSTDREILEKARETDRVIITFDSDFVVLDEKHPGVIRITSPDRYSVIAESVKQLLSDLEEKDLRNNAIQLSPRAYGDINA